MQGTITLLRAVESAGYKAIILTISQRVETKYVEEFGFERDFLKWPHITNQEMLASFIFVCIIIIVFYLLQTSV